MLACHLLMWCDCIQHKARAAKHRRDDERGVCDGVCWVTWLRRLEHVIDKAANDFLAVGTGFCCWCCSRSSIGGGGVGGHVPVESDVVDGWLQCILQLCNHFAGQLLPINGVISRATPSTCCNHDYDAIVMKSCICTASNLTRTDAVDNLVAGP